MDDRLQRLVTAALDACGSARQPVQGFLNGTWLGRPLHPMLTDVPIGSWTVAGVCDALELVTGRKEFDTGADVAIAVGLVGATGAVVTGLADWQYLVDRPRRVGLVHGLLNVGAVTLYAVSFGLRRSGAPGAGRGIAAVAYGLVTVSGYFGVEFVFNIKDLAQVKIQGGVAEITEKGDTTMVSFSKDYRP